MRSYATDKDGQYVEAMAEHLDKQQEIQTSHAMINGFAKYARRQDITRFLAHYEIFKLVQDIQGCIVECGVRGGQGLMSWAQISAILEPVGGAFRHVYGFDTFEGFPSVAEKDVTSGAEQLDWKPGDLSVSSHDDILRCIELLDMNRLLAQFPKVSLIKGDFLETGRQFLDDNPHVLVSLLYLDFDLYEPTKAALEIFLPRMGRGSVVAFDEINHPLWPGETLAMLEAMDIREISVRKVPFDINISYVVL